MALARWNAALTGHPKHGHYKYLAWQGPLPTLQPSSTATSCPARPRVSKDPHYNACPVNKTEERRRRGRAVLETVLWGLVSGQACSYVSICEFTQPHSAFSMFQYEAGGEGKEETLSLRTDGVREWNNQTRPRGIGAGSKYVDPDFSHVHRHH